MNKTSMTLVSAIIVITAVIIGSVLFYLENNNEKKERIITQVAEEEIFDDCTDEYESLQHELSQVNSQDIKVSPNCSFIIEKTYNKCKHKTSEYMNLPQELINNTREEVQRKYPDYTIEKFTENEIILSKSEERECGEHFIVKEKEGNVFIYKIEEDGTEREIEETAISTEYLTDTDKINMKNGIRVNGKQNLNQLIEDFE